MSALTTVAAVKSYLTITTTNQDAIIASLIPRESALVERWTGRTFPSVTNTNKWLNGTGTSLLVLPDNPIISVSALSILGTTIPASSDNIQWGYTNDETCLYLIGDKFPRGYQNVKCSWVAGYQTSETALVPAGNTITPTTGGTAVTVVSVTDVTAGTTMTQVSASPATGQFSFSAGVFTFNAAQLNHSVTMSYYYVPAPIEQAVIEMVALDLQQRSSIGMTSKSVGGETVSYSQKGMTESAKELCMQYRRMVAAS